MNANVKSVSAECVKNKKISFSRRQYISIVFTVYCAAIKWKKKKQKNNKCRFKLQLLFLQNTLKE